MIARPVGTVVGTRAHLVEAALPAPSLGDRVRIATRCGVVAARIDAIRERIVLLTPDDDVGGVAAGDRVEADPGLGAVALGAALLGRAVDPAGRPLDGRPAPRPRPGRAAGRLRPLDRAPVRTPLWTGVRALDGLLTLGRGGRVGIFGAPGAGKSTLLEQIVTRVDADAVVVALVGERGREAERWIRGAGTRTSVVCAPGERSAAERVRAADVALAQAEALRDGGLDVLMVWDSLARTAAALREQAVVLGEPPGRGGYPPSVFAHLARLVERAGNAATGSISLVATVLTDGADERDPVTDAARSLLDGHLVLDARLAQAGRFPALDVPASASRTMRDVVGQAHAAAAGRVRAALARLRESEDLRAAGLQVPGADPALERAVAALPRLERFLYADEPGAPERTLHELLALADTL